MGIAALVLGIVSIIFAFIPCTSWFGIITAIVGLVLGIIDIVKKNKSGEKKGTSVAGTICAGVALIIAFAWYFLVVAAANNVATAINSYDWNELASQLSSYDYNY